MQTQSCGAVTDSPPTRSYSAIQGEGVLAADSLVPIVIGITGHRDLRPDDRAALEMAVRELLVSLRSSYPRTPFLVLSALAEGADRLMARIALECGAKLLVPLPFAREEYEKDFETPESRAEFAGLLRQSVSVLEVGLVHGATPASILRGGPDRERQYEAVGAWVARHCQLLVALWDGLNLGLTGGTAAVVDLKLGRKVAIHAPRADSLDPPECGPVYHLVSPRKQNPMPVGTPFSLQTIYPPSWGPTNEARHAWSAVLERIDHFNAEAYALTSRFSHEMATASHDAIGDDPLPNRYKALVARYIAADALARCNQGRRLWSLRALFALAVSGVATFVVYDDVLRETASARWMLFLYVGMFAAAYVVFAFGSRRRYEENFFEYRALAEGLRVQLHWALAGINADAADYYLRKQRTELDWIRAAMRNSHLALAADVEAVFSGSVSAIRRVYEHWVRGQEDYFTKAARRNDRWGANINRSAVVLIVAALAASVLLASAHHRISGHRWLHNTFTVGIILLLAFAGALKGYAGKLALSDESKQYHRMAGFFHRADEQLVPLIDRTELALAQALLLEMGKEALRENGDWVLLHRSRPMEVPAGA